MKKTALLLTGLLLTVSGFVVSNPLFFGFCNEKYSFGDKQGCLDDSIELYGAPLFIFGIAILLVGIMYAVLPIVRSRSLIIFSTIWLSLATLLIGTTPTTSNTGMPLYFIGRELITWIMAALYVVASLFIIIVSYIRRK